MARPAAQQPWLMFKAFFSDGVDSVDNFPKIPPPQDIDKVDCFPEPLPSPETGGNETDQPPKAHKKHDLSNVGFPSVTPN